MGSNGKGTPIFAPGECAAAKFYVDHRKEVSPCTKYQLIEKFADLQQLVAEELPIVPISAGNQIAAVKKDVEGVTLAPSTNYMNFSTIRIPKR